MGKCSQYQSKMRMNLITILVISATLLAFGEAKGSKTEPCKPKAANGKRCSYGRGQEACIPPVRKTLIKDVRQTSFVVTWKPVPAATCYYVEILTDSSSHVYKTVSCYRGTTFKATGLKSWRTYSARVSAIDQSCQRGRSGKIVLVRTLWMSTPDTTTTPLPTFSPKIGKCGRGYFTCKTEKKQCVPRKRFCNRVLNCDDGSDERGCPGGCTEIDVDFKSGNFSCSRWGSPWSVCKFECRPPHTLDGSRYTQCNRKRRKWTKKVPTCRLHSPRIMKVLEEKSTSTSLTVEWESVQGAVEYLFLLIATSSDVEPTVKKINSTECCTTTITDLKPKTTFEVTMKAVDDDGVGGIDSLPAFGSTT